MSAAPLWRPAGLVLLSSVSLQLGLAVASSTFAVVGPLPAVWVRSVVAAALLWAYIRPDVRSFTRAQLGPVVLYGVALACMSLSVFVAISDAPLGLVSAIVMLGALGVAAWGQRTPFDLGLVALAACGALLLTLSRGTSGTVGVVGLVASFLAAASFAAYIVVGKRVNSRDGAGLPGLAVALVIAAVVQTPLGVALAPPSILDLAVLATLAVAGVLASLVPFTLEAVALRTLPMATFGLLLAFEPAVAAIMGRVVRGDALTAVQWLGIALIVVAAAGSLGPRDWMRRMGRNNEELMRDPKVAALGRVPLFDALSASELATLAGAVQERDVPEGDVVTREGDPGDEFFVIEAGAVGITTHGRHVRDLGVGDYLGEIALLFGGPRTATATASEPSTLFVLPKQAFLDLLAAHPDIEDKVLTTVSERMRYR